MSKISLFEKYDIPAPRYTSYPTVPYWTDPPNSEQWINFLAEDFKQEGMTWSMYIHIPYCESLCTFCGCNTTITRNHDVEAPYLNHLIRELDLYLKKVPSIKNRPLKNIHIGGGTPTFFSADNLHSLISEIQKRLTLADDFLGSIEVDPRKTNREQLEKLYTLGFKRVSLGVQDFNHDVQEIVNRIQPFEMTKEIIDIARDIGYTSNNFDLIYGMPLQDKEKIRNTVQKTIELRPDRIALYSLAMVPWIKPAHRKFKDSDLPKGKEKRELYEISRQLLLDAGYIEIGMDHFALPTDSLSKALERGELYRNFMGYTTKKTDVLLGIGVSSISESSRAFHQNIKVLPLYEESLNLEKLPTLRGHILDGVDVRRRQLILKLITTYELKFASDLEKQEIIPALKPLIEDGLVELNDLKLIVLDQGRPFIRNICMAFDLKLLKDKPETQVFSQAL